MIARTLLLASTLLPLPALAQTPEQADETEILVTAQRNNQTQVRREGQVGILRDKPAEDVPFSVRS